jgi:hypothetical protein
MKIKNNKKLCKFHIIFHQHTVHFGEQFEVLHRFLEEDGYLDHLVETRACIVSMKDTRKV